MSLLIDPSYIGISATVSCPSNPRTPLLCYTLSWLDTTLFPFLRTNLTLNNFPFTPLLPTTRILTHTLSLLFVVVVARKSSFFFSKPLLPPPPSPHEIFISSKSAARKAWKKEREKERLLILDWFLSVVWLSKLLVKGVRSVHILLETTNRHPHLERTKASQSSNLSTVDFFWIIPAIIKQSIDLAPCWSQSFVPSYFCDNHIIRALLSDTPSRLRTHSPCRHYSVLITLCNSTSSTTTTAYFTPRV